MNREQKRAMQKAGALDEQGEVSSTQPRAKPTPRPSNNQQAGIFERIRTFFSEVSAELKKVAWPNRQELSGYTSVVIVSLLFVGLLVFGIDYGCNKAIIFLFQS